MLVGLLQHRCLGAGPPAEGLSLDGAEPSFCLCIASSRFSRVV